MPDVTLYCSRCTCVYGTLIKRVGQRCGDLSYLGAAHLPTTVRGAKAMGCSGRLTRRPPPALKASP